MNRILLVSALLVALLPGLSVAQPYVGIDLGTSRWDVDQADVQDGSVSGKIDRGDTSVGLRLGYAITNAVAFEVAYRDLGESTLEGRSSGGWFWCAGPVEAVTDGAVLDVTVLGSLNVTSAFRLYGRAGMARWDAEVRVKDSCVNASGDDDGTELTYGAGLEYAFTPSASLRGEWQRYPDVLDELDVDVYSVGLVFRF